jgi:hypothetical protein
MLEHRPTDRRLIIAIEDEARKGYVPASLSPEWHAELNYVAAEARAALLADIRERLATLLDHHWLYQGAETGAAHCTCGAWSFDALSGQHPLPVMGERFAPFSEHVAAAVLAELDAS